MSKLQVRIAGFGGQGVVTAGRVLGMAAAIYEGKNTVNTQSYGPESRGGACRSEVVISDTDLLYPRVRSSDALIALSRTAFDVYGPNMAPGSLLIVDPNSVQGDFADLPVRVFFIPAAQIAYKLGNIQAQNMVALGALQQLTGVVSLDSLAQAIRDAMPEHTWDQNIRAFLEGAQHARELNAPHAAPTERALYCKAGESPRASLPLLDTGVLAPGNYFLQGSEAVMEGAFMAGCRCFGGYPITPASEVMEAAARRMPQTGGYFIQMEDELAAACSLIGASWSGAKAMTATSSPGFSLMHEAISFAIMTETPFLIVDVQRPGPGQGYITSSQEDVMAARWGHHGEGSLIVLAPASVQEMYDLTVEAFNYAEAWRTPVIMLADEAVAHMRERIAVPPRESIRIVDRPRPQDEGISKEEYLPLGGRTVPPMAAFGDGYQVDVVSLIHTPDGRVNTYSSQLHMDVVRRKLQKIEDNASRIAKLETRFLEGARSLVVCYGASSRSSLEAVMEARDRGRSDVGYLRMVTLWPFPEETLRRLVPPGVQRIIMPEMNLGMMIHPVREALRDRMEKFVPVPSLGTIHTPEMILEAIEAQ